MIKRFTAKCLDCKQRFEDELGGPESDTRYTCQKCGEKIIVSLKESESNAIPKNCEKLTCPCLIFIKKLLF